MRQQRHAADEEGEGYFASVSDLMVGILFVFLLMLTVFALNYRQAEQEQLVQRSLYERLAAQLQQQKLETERQTAEAARQRQEADRQRREAETQKQRNDADSDEDSRRFRLKPATCSDGSQPVIPTKPAGVAERTASGTNGVSLR